MDWVVDADNGTAPVVAGSAQSATQGRGGMDTVIGSARSGVAAIAPATDTQAGRVELVDRLQGELDRAKALLRVSEQRNIELARIMRAQGAGYGGGFSPMGAGMPSMSGGMPSGGGATTPTLSGLPNIANFIRHSPQDRQNPDFPQLTIDGQSRPAAAQAVKFALTKLGSRYVWGAKGPDAFDCSGLVHWAYAQAGVTLGTDTYALINQGAPVAPGHVTAGDTIFPKSSFGEGGKSGPGHVMLAINDHECIEAQQTGVPVKISPMPKDYFARRPLGA
jgi:cell wall-associated NlpC family hydrolase